MTEEAKDWHEAHLNGYHARSVADLIWTDAFEWLAQRETSSIHAVVTDPPYGLIEYTTSQLRKRAERNGGIWRIPPSFDGCERSPLPRFTVLGERERDNLRNFFDRLARELIRVLVPGAHVFVAKMPVKAATRTHPACRPTSRSTS